ncbi:5-oxoprolinase subunit PxpA [Polaribacter uvawellassae]|uniref:5-oxoprolinase subunit PxpA n=1 Tax=Polaribacter uvawellassae TaxID=3133495 RepID=UPI00321A54E0
MKIVDFNCDVGEGVENERLLMPYISSCNIACGGHFGDKQTIDKSIQLAIDNQVKIGAHPSFPDKENFGRKTMNISDKELQKSIVFQMKLFQERLQKKNTKLHHVKAHGALYNLIARDKKAAIVFINAIKKYVEGAYLFVPYNSEIEKVAIKNNINIKYEAFADRNYNDDLSLVSRTKSNAIITNSTEVYQHVLLMIGQKQVKTISNSTIKIKAETFCVHGDNLNALEILKDVTFLLKTQNIHVA